jgi:hypothetical protein
MYTLTFCHVLWFNFLTLEGASNSKPIEITVAKYEERASFKHSIFIKYCSCIKSILMGSFVKKAQYLFVEGGQIQRGNVSRGSID